MPGAPPGGAPSPGGRTRPAAAASTAANVRAASAASANSAAPMACASPVPGSSSDDPGQHPDAAAPPAGAARAAGPPSDAALAPLTESPGSWPRFCSALGLLCGSVPFVTGWPLLLAALTARTQSAAAGVTAALLMHSALSGPVAAAAASALLVCGAPAPPCAVAPAWPFAAAVPELLARPAAAPPPPRARPACACCSRAKPLAGASAPLGAAKGPGAERSPRGRNVTLKRGSSGAGGSPSHGLRAPTQHTLAARPTASRAGATPLPANQ